MYSDSHRLLLQILISRKCMEEQVLLHTFGKILREFNVDVGADLIGTKSFVFLRLHFCFFFLNRLRTDQLQSYITDINQHLHTLFFQVRKQIWEKDGKTYWGVVSTRTTEMQDFAKLFGYDESQLKLFKETVESQKKKKIAQKIKIGG